MDNAMMAATEQFVYAVKATGEYREYVNQRERISSYPELKAQIDEYRERNFLMQTTAEPEEIFDKMEEFQKEYEALREEPLVSDFLAAELGFCRMMQSAYGLITELLDFE